MSKVNFCSGELIHRKDVSGRLAVFTFRCAEPLSFKAGQYATLRIPGTGELVERPYSIVSSPRESCLEFFIELVPTGLFTPKLWSMRLGSAIQIRRRVVGQFTLDRSINRHLMIATVTGVAPFISMIRTQQLERQLVAGVREQFLLIHGASRSEDFGPYYHELEEVAGEGWLTYVPTISRPWEELNWRGETGRVEDIVERPKRARMLECPRGVQGHEPVRVGVRGRGIEPRVYRLVRVRVERVDICDGVPQPDVRVPGG